MRTLRRPRTRYLPIKWFTVKTKLAERTLNLAKKAVLRRRLHTVEELRDPLHRKIVRYGTVAEFDALYTKKKRAKVDKTRVIKKNLI